jgi:hypothetical protein
MIDWAYQRIPFVGPTSNRVTAMNVVPGELSTGVHDVKMDVSARETLRPKSVTM